MGKTLKITEKMAELIERSWMGLDAGIDWVNPFDLMTDDDWANPDIYMLRMIRKPENFPLTCKLLFNFELLPYQNIILNELWKTPFPILLASRGAAKSTLSAMYILLRALFLQGRKIIIVAPSFRQSKNVMNYVEGFWNSSPILQDIVSGCILPQGPRHDTDRWTLRVGNSLISALPIGDGERIRGERANDTVVDEFQSMPSTDILERVVGGFSIVSSNPVEKVKHYAKMKVLKELGILQSEQNITPFIKNQQLITGTAHYSWNHFAKYHQKWKNIIESGGNIEKLERVFTTEEGIVSIPDGFDYKDYGIIRIPVDLLPDGYMDDSQIARAKATMHVGLYLSEYLCCLVPETKIITDSGIKDIQNIVIGDNVFTHNGRFKKVTNVMKRYVNEDIFKFNTYGYNKSIEVTKNHPFWMGQNKFSTLNKIESTLLPNLVELNGKQSIDLVELFPDISGHKDYVYPANGRSKLNYEKQEYVRNSKKRTCELVKELNVSYGIVLGAKKIIKSKNSIPRYIKLDYDFGLIMGYYASEGSCGAKNRAVSFALDEHNNTLYVAQLKSAIKKVFGLDVKYWYHNNCITTTINSSLIVRLMKYICPGVSHTKFIKPDILFSNSEFIKGFVEGYWNGDGNVHQDSRTAKVGCVNLSLISQVRLCLSYFGISSSVSDRIVKGGGFGRGKIITFRMFQLVVHGDNFQNLCDLINVKTEKYNNFQHVKNDGSKTVLKIKNKEIINYSGLVYNLEVEDDHSYCLINGAVHNCFCDDTTGFFRASLINGATANEENINKWGNHFGEEMRFVAKTRGENFKYVMGIDPAAERDNFAIVILELHENHRRVVYCWTINKAKHRELVKLGVVQENDYFAYCANKIRELSKLFPTEHIGIDFQGGGNMIAEALHNEKYGEPIWPIVEDSPKDTDNHPGRHIIYPIQFANARWTSEANHGLRKDLEDKIIIFPTYDPIIITETSAGMYDTTEEVMEEVEEIKNELVMIVHSSTGSRERWDTPEVKMDGKKGRQVKDRYSALLIANMLAREINAPKAIPIYSNGFVRGEGMYSGPEWFTKQIGNAPNNYGF